MTDDAALELLREIRDELRGIREAIEAARRPARVLRHEDRIAMARILPVLHAHFSGSTFATWELIDCAAANDVLRANLRSVLGKRTPQQLGKLFQRSAGHDMDGVVLRRAGQDENGARWECLGN